MPIHVPVRTSMCMHTLAAHCDAAHELIGVDAAVAVRVEELEDLHTQQPVAVRACVLVCMRTCLRACMRACVRAHLFAQDARVAKVLACNAYACMLAHVRTHVRTECDWIDHRLRVYGRRPASMTLARSPTPFNHDHCNYQSHFSGLILRKTTRAPSSIKRPPMADELQND